jgi:5-methylthioadenosine/S-adenosylhomocysteine deaminase
MADRILIQGGCVLTMERVNYLEADVLIEGDTIIEVGIGLRARGAYVVDASRSIVMPGFVDSHRHAADSLFRNAGSTAGAGATYGSADVYAATLAGLLGAADAGITTVVDWCEVASDASTVDSALKAHVDSGVRTVLVQSVGGQQQLADPGSAGGLHRVAAGSRDVEDNVDDLASDWSRARDQGVRIHAHVGRAEGAIASLAERSLLGDDVTLVRCAGVGDSALDALASSGTRVALTPARDMASGEGAVSVQGLVDRDIRPGLGVGSERVTSGDLFSQMRAVISLQHATVFDRKLAGQAGLPRLMSTRDVIRYATVDGARAVGLAGVTGTLEPGMKADVIVIDVDRPNIHPVNDPIGAVVWGVDTSNVTWVFVGGNPIKKAGSLQADVGAVREAAAAAHKRVAASALAGTGEAR